MKRHPDRGDRRDRDSGGDSGRGGGAGGEIISRVREGASGALHSVMEGAQSVTQQLKETTGEVTGAVLDTLLDEAERIYRKQKKPAISRISGLSKMADRTAHALHAVKADGVADYVEQAAEQVGSMTEYLQDRSLEEILEDAGEIVQKNRAMAMGGMFLLAFAAARFLKASASRDEEATEGDNADEEQQDDETDRPARRQKKPKRRGR
jgi:hypothetical protein